MSVNPPSNALDARRAMKRWDGKCQEIVTDPQGFMEICEAPAVAVVAHPVEADALMPVCASHHAPLTPGVGDIP